MDQTETSPLLENYSGSEGGRKVFDLNQQVPECIFISCQDPEGHSQPSCVVSHETALKSPVSLQPRLSNSPPCEFRVYSRRWYILLLYSLVSATQCGVCYTFGPISATAEEAFGWTDATVALLINWPPIVYVFVGVVFTWLLDKKGLRISCLFMGFFVATGTALRCVTMEPPDVTWFMHISQFLAGLAGPVAMAAPPYLSVTWFPPHERTTATAIGCSCSALGVAVSFILGPELVPDVPFNSTKYSGSAFSGHRIKGSMALPDGSVSWKSQTLNNSDTEQDREQRISTEKKAIHLYMYMAAGWSVGLFLIMLIYFPSKPPRPPSASASIQRSSFQAGLKHLSTRGQFWLVCSVNSISMGVLAAWNSVLDVILKAGGIRQEEAGWIGFCGQCAGFVVTLVVARFADRFSRIFKCLVVAVYVIATVSFLIITLAVIGIIPSSPALLYIFVVVGVAALSAASPLMFELACELTYPTGEGTTCGILSLVQNLVIVIFLSVMMIPNIGTMWTNWTLFGSAGLSLLLLLPLKEKYNRLEIDNSTPSVQQQQ